jgi:hypothetical protein
MKMAVTCSLGGRKSHTILACEALFPEEALYRVSVFAGLVSVCILLMTELKVMTSDVTCVFWSVLAIVEH